MPEHNEPRPIHSDDEILRRVYRRGARLRFRRRAMRAASIGVSLGLVGSAVAFSPEHPHPGDVITFVVTYDDPDAAIDADHTHASFGDPATGSPPQSLECSGRYGPWSPPERRHGHLVTEYHHSYAEAGEKR